MTLHRASSPHFLALEQHVGDYEQHDNVASSAVSCGQTISTLSPSGSGVPRIALHLDSTGPSAPGLMIAFGHHHVGLTSGPKTGWLLATITQGERRRQRDTVRASLVSRTKERSATDG